MVSIAIAGSHRTGKTTLAQSFAFRINLKFIPNSTSTILRKMNVDPSQNMTFHRRMYIQNIILDQYEKDISKEKNFIIDRSPLDFAAYMMADVTQSNGSSIKDFFEFQKYLERCFDIANEHISIIVLLQPGIKPIIDKNKAVASVSKAYIETLNTILVGLINDDRCQSQTFLISKEYLNITERVNATLVAIKMALKRTDQFLLDEKIH